MKLYFENSRGQRRIIAEPETRDDAWTEIHNFCEERDFHIYYVRTWKTPDGAEVYDVGSHSEFFYLFDE